MKIAAYKRGGHAGKIVLLSLLVWLGVLLLGMVLITSLVWRGSIDETMIPAISCAIVFGASVMGGVIASAEQQVDWIPLVASAALAYLILIGINVMIFDGSLQRLGVGTLALLLGSATAVGLKLLPIRSGQKKKIKYKFR